jgi:hypothetical protein
LISKMFMIVLAGANINSNSDARCADTKKRTRAHWARQTRWLAYVKNRRIPKTERSANTTWSSENTANGTLSDQNLIPVASIFFQNGSFISRLFTVSVYGLNIHCRAIETLTS